MGRGGSRPLATRIIRLLPAPSQLGGSGPSYQIPAGDQAPFAACGLDAAGTTTLPIAQMVKYGTMNDNGGYGWYTATDFYNSVVFCDISVLVMPKWGCDKMIVFPCTFGDLRDALLVYINALMNLELLSTDFA